MKSPVLATLVNMGIAVLLYWWLGFEVAALLVLAMILTEVQFVGEKARD